MAISTFSGLEGIVGEIEGQIESAKNEREELGLVMPKKYDVYVYFSSIDNYAASAWMHTDDRGMIGIFLLNTVSPFFNAEKRQDLKVVRKYYDVLFALFGMETELKIHDFFNNGRKEIELFEQQFQKGDSFQVFKEQYHRQHRRPYNEDVRYLLENASSVQETFLQLLPYMVSLFPMAGKYIRHELDHLDFFKSKLWKRHTKQENLVATLAKLYKDHPKTVQKGYAEANLYSLKLQSVIRPILEGRALFFDHVEPYAWYCADFAVVAQQVKKHLHYYIHNSFSLLILNRLIVAAEIEHGLSDDTKQYMYHQVYKKIGNNRAILHPFQEKNVNINLAQHILQKEMGQWKRRFAETSNFTVPALQIAYEQDASRFLTANTAGDYINFIRSCRGLRE